MLHTITQAIYTAADHGYNVAETVSTISEQVNAQQVATDVGAAVLAVMLIVLFIGAIVANIFFCLSVYRAMKCVPEQHRLFPAWLIWLSFIPGAGLVIAWMMEPFGVPTSFKNAVAGNEQAVADSKTLFGIGLAHVIVITLVFIPFVGIFLCLPGGLILWIIYWVKLVNFKNKYLLK